MQGRHSRALHRLLAARYPNHPTLALLGDGSRPFPVWVHPAPVTQWDDLEAALGSLDLSRPLPGLREWDYGEACDPSGEPEFHDRVAAWDRQLHEVQSGRRRNVSTWNQLTYDLASMERSDMGLRIRCKLGTYFHSLATSEALEREATEACSGQPDEEGEPIWSRLRRRAWLHDRVRDPVEDGRHRSAALGISTLTVARIERGSVGGYAMLLSPDSVTDPGPWRRHHVVPSGMFQPFAGDGSHHALRAHFSVRLTVLRELVEELYGVEEIETGNGRIDHRAIFERPEARAMAGMLDRGAARLLYTGVAVNLLALRPEICTILIIDDPGWLETQVGHLRLCDEHTHRDPPELRPDQRWVQPIPLSGDRLEPDPAWAGVLQPGTLHEPAGAAVDLGLRVVRAVLA